MELVQFSIDLNPQGEYLMRWKLALIAIVGILPGVAGAADEPAQKPERFEVPYKLTDTKHVLVRAKINGKGPFNMILDTGAPAVFITKPVAKKVGVEVNDKGWGELDKFEIEGGLKVDQGQGPRRRPRADRRHEQHGTRGRRVARRHRLQRAGKVPHRRTTSRQTSSCFESLPGFEPPRSGDDRGGRARATTSGDGADD